EMLLQKPNVISSLKGAKDKYNTDTKPSEFNGIIGDLYMRNSKGEISEKFQAYFFLPEGDQQMSYDTALRHYYDTRFKDIRQDARIKYVILNTVNQKMVSKFSPDYYEYGFWEDYNRGDGHRTTVEMSDYFNQFLRDNNLRGRLLIDSNGKCMATGYSWDSETEYGRRKHCSAKEIDFYDPFRDDYVKNVYGEMENRSFLDVPGQISKLMDANLLSNEMLLLVCQSWLNAIANRKFDIKDQAQLWENKLYIANIFCKNKQQDSITEEIFKEAISIDRREKNTNQITRAIKIGVLTEVLAEKLFMSHYIHSNISGSAKFELLSLLDEKFRESKSEDAVRKNLDRVFIIDQHEKNTSSIIRSIDNTLFKEPDDLTFVTSVKELLPQYVASKAFSQEQVDYLYFYYLNAFKNIYSQQSSDLNTVLSQIPDRVRRLAIMIQLGYATDQDKRDYYTLRKEDLILEGVAAKGKIVDRDSFMKAFEIFNNIFKMDSALRQLTKVEKIEKIEDATPAKPPLPFTLPTDVSLGQFFSLINVDLEKFKKTNSIKSLIEKKLYYNDNRIIGNLIAASKKQKLLIEDPKEQLDLTGFRTALTTAMQDKDISPDLKRLLQEIHQQFTEIGGCYEVNLPSPAYSIQGHQSSPSA
ncbi:MAG: hypothetical protein JSS53_08090, partial [Proteobacteria bacterium]|nr:hypothetical protein [Pseudomonadota bacterium]